jgi:hypothetical protein
VPIQKADKEEPREIIVATVPAPASSPTRLVAAKSRRRPRQGRPKTTERGRIDLSRRTPQPIF